MDVKRHSFAAFYVTIQIFFHIKQQLAIQSMEELGIIIPRSATGTIKGASPANWTWHHAPQTGILQLIPKSQHWSTDIWSLLHPNNKGGMFFWGGK